MESSTWFKKSALALVASIVFSMSPSIQAAPWYKSINKKSVTVVAVGAFLIYFFTKQESKNPLTTTTFKEKFDAAVAKFKAAQTSEEKKAALKEIVCLLMTASDDIIIGHKGKEKGLQAEGKVRCEGVEEVSTARADDGQELTIIKYKDVQPYGLIGTAWAKIQPAAKGVQAIAGALLAFDTVNRWVE